MDNVEFIVKRFTASWCGPCRSLKPIVESLEGSFPQVTFQTIDVEQYSEEATAYGVRSIPAVIFLKNGVEVNRIVGLQSKASYFESLNTLTT